jgi:LemA protein
MEALLIVLAVLVIVVFMVIGVYNGLIKLKNEVDSSWSDIDTQLKRRFDLIPNIVESVKGYAKHEASVFENVTNARSQAMQATGPAEMAKAENMLQGALKSLFAVAEAYPDLKANQNFLELQNTLTQTEDEINKARRYYNAVVRDFNTKLQVFPNNIIAGMFNFKAREFFELDSPEERKNVKVSFDAEKKE